MASNPVPPEPAVGGDDQPAEDDIAATTLTGDVSAEAHCEADNDGQPADDDSAATTLTGDVTVEAHCEADDGCDSARYVPV